MNARITRRDSFQVRRDAALELPNGRIAYDALFTRWGNQAYETGVEYRPFDEVERSMLTLPHLPGVLIHPTQNFGTDFGPGSYPVRGCTASGVDWDEQRVHTKGQLIVWDDEWNGLIASVEVVELSAGFTIDEDMTPGEAPEGAPGTDEYGRTYVSIQRDIICDHMAGVPEGNAGTARVITDAKRSQIPQATRLMLAEVAAARMDARPMYFDLGRLEWPTSRQDQDPTMDKKAKFAARLDALNKAGTATEKTIRDAWVDIYGETNDPDMLAMLAGLAAGGTSSPAPASTVVADAEEEEPAGSSSEGGESSGESEDEGEEEEREGEEETDEDMEKKEGDRADKERARLDLKKRHDAEDARADAMYVGRKLMGDDFSGRADGKRMTTPAIQLAALAAVNPTRADRISKMDAGDRRVALRLDFAELVEQVKNKAYRAPTEDLMRAINDARGARHDEGVDAQLQEVIARLDTHARAAMSAKPTPKA